MSIYIVAIARDNESIIVHSMHISATAYCDVFDYCDIEVKKKYNNCEIQSICEKLADNLDTEVIDTDDTLNEYYRVYEYFDDLRNLIEDNFDIEVNTVDNFEYHS